MSRSASAKRRKNRRKFVNISQFTPNVPWDFPFPGNPPLAFSGKVYLEAILVLAKKSGYVRSIDVSEYLGYSKPSVSRAMGILREGGYILMEKDGAITLTDSGKKLAETIYERHTVLSELLIRLGVDEKTATDDACRIEHVISDESFQAIKQYYYQHKK